jgi:hypothetical protein
VLKKGLASLLSELTHLIRAKNLLEKLPPVIET